MRREFGQVEEIRTLIVGILAAALAVWSASGTAAQTLEEALSLAYVTNPEIAAERAQLDATEEGVVQARARGLPQITAGAGYQKVDNTQSINGEVFNVGAGGRDFKLDTATAQVSGEQQIFAGLRNVNAIRQAKARARAG
ncbi:MAG TPA: TolC family protein, partial [Parvularculaceae bacterium]|nr:TolC family protein [Parvularculaceae bacterium]